MVSELAGLRGGKYETSGPEAACPLDTDAAGRATQIGYRLGARQLWRDWDWADGWRHRNVRGTVVCLELGRRTQEHPEGEPDH
jgi:hypothetical protein